jgi:predicted nucleic acid-binding protein
MRAPASGFALDCSIALAWCFAEEHTPAVLGVPDRLAREGALVPPIWPFEVSNVLHVAMRRGRIDGVQRVRFRDMFAAYPIEVDAESSGRAWREVDDLAAKFLLTACDASYLELAIRARVPLATLDDAMRRAATEAGVAVWGHASDPRA